MKHGAAIMKVPFHPQEVSEFCMDMSVAWCRMNAVASLP